MTFLKDIGSSGVVNKEFISSGDYEVVVRGKKYPAMVHLAPLHKNKLI